MCMPSLSCMAGLLMSFHLQHAFVISELEGLHRSQHEGLTQKPMEWRPADLTPRPMAFRGRSWLGLLLLCST